MKFGGFFLFFLVSCTSGPNGEIGLVNGELHSCPSTPNAVSSMVDPGNDTHYIAPLMYKGSREDAHNSLKNILLNYRKEEVKIVTVTEEYIYAEFTSKFLKITNDLEIYFPTDKHYVHIRSLSRVGFQDFGRNRERVEDIRTLLLTDY
jgi:uncharacterized protein (DUF1499 family)